MDRPSYGRQGLLPACRSLSWQTRPWWTRAASGTLRTGIAPSQRLLGAGWRRRSTRSRRRCRRALLQPLSRAEALETLAAAVRDEVPSEQPDWRLVAKLAGILAR